MPPKTPQPGGKRRQAFPHVMTVRLDSEAYAWLTTISQEGGDELAVSTLARLAIQWAHWIDVDYSTRFPKRAPKDAFAAYVRSETGTEQET